jgi:hypothetical protein
MQMFVRPRIRRRRVAGNLVGSVPHRSVNGEWVGASDPGTAFAFFARMLYKGRFRSGVKANISLADPEIWFSHW